MKKILLTAIFTVLFSTSVFASVKENREVECWDMKSFVEEVFKPLNLHLFNEAVIERHKDGKKKKTIDMLVSVNKKGVPVGYIITEVTITPKFDDSPDYNTKVCILTSWLN